jgi:hypothetical protein
MLILVPEDEEGGDRSVGTVRLRTKGHGICFLFEDEENMFLRIIS